MEVVEPEIINRLSTKWLYWIGISSVELDSRIFSSWKLHLFTRFDGCHQNGGIPAKAINLRDLERKKKQEKNGTQSSITEIFYG
ncbi:hypothetical protein CEXT_801411 [Caerostris extrusa]|uniref:Uncharacterized protein n=1 Tax=Caerostris extrusa TaxID=172846 RepID=A0AAV4QG79_CAEEX|nr:hypothetical protein CEXT_801411 [Caerostris extrusa]